MQKGSVENYFLHAYGARKLDDGRIVLLMY